MDRDSNSSSIDPRDDPDDARRLRELADALADGVERALGPWVQRNVERLLVAYRGTVTEEEQSAARRAAIACTADVAPAVREVLARDIDAQATNPLAIVRRAVPYPTEVLRAAGVPAVVRDEHNERLFPDDDYDLTPASFADLDPALRDVGLEWGAAKAHVHLRRRRADGQR